MAQVKIITGKPGKHGKCLQVYPERRVVNWPSEDKEIVIANFNNICDGERDSSVQIELGYEINTSKRSEKICLLGNFERHYEILAAKAAEVMSEEKEIIVHIV